MAKAEQKIKYEPHPVSAKRKKELRAKGFKIIDARFDPVRKDEPVEAPVPQSPEDVAGLKKPGVIKFLEAHGADTVGGVDELRDRLTETMFVQG